MQHKLVSPNDTLLGTVTIDQWTEQLFNKCPDCTFRILVRPLTVVPMSDTVPTTVDIKCVTLGVSYGRYKDALCLVQGTVEDLEKIDGCSFSPSMAYLRSQIESANI